MATDANEPTDLTIRTDDPPKPGASTALAIQRAGTMQTAFASLMPSSIGEVMVLATHLAKSKAIPKTLREAGPDTVFTVIWAGMELGLTPIRSLQSITNISGTLCMKADLQLALAQNRAVLAFYDEGFEEKGKTDANLPARIKLAMRLAKVPDTDDQAELVVGKIQSVVEGLATGKPYGWAMGIRIGGNHQVQVRTFTFADAERAIIYEADPDNPGSPKERKPLSEKFNYKSFPGDMYPKRARTRLLQVLAPDATNGLPAAEQLEGGQVIDAEFTVHHGGDAGPAPDTVDTMLAALREADADAATTAEAGFDQLKMSPAARLQKLVQFKGKPKDLVAWLKDEYAHRKGVDRAQPDVLSGQPAKAADAKPADAKPAAVEPKAQPGPIIDAEVADDRPAAEQQQPLDSRAHAGDGGGAAKEAGAVAAAERAAAAQPMTPARALADKFKKQNLRSI